MNPFVHSNEVTFSLVLILYLLAGLLGIICLAMSLSYRLKLTYVLPGLGISLTSILLFSFLIDGIRIRYLNENPSNLTGSLCFLPLWSVILIIVSLLALAVLLLILIIKKRLSSLTGMSIKEALAILPAGICFYDEAGRILLANEQIEINCQKETGASLTDGIIFWKELSINDKNNTDSIIKEDNKPTLYKRITHHIENKTIYEIDSFDISKEFALKKELETKNNELKEMKTRLREYGDKVIELTREKEILATKVKVHSNLGSLLLRSKKALAEEESNLDDIIKEWNDLASLMFAGNESEDRFKENEQTSANVGVKLIYKGDYPEKGTNAEKIFASAIFECIVNTARHANGTLLNIVMSQKEDTHYIEITNNGKQPTSIIKETGGLSSLRKMVENSKGEMRVTSFPRFKLEISLKEEK